MVVGFTVQINRRQFDDQDRHSDRAGARVGS